MLRALAAAFALIVLALAGGAIYVATNLESLVNDYRDEMGTTVSDFLGRQVRFGPVRLTWNDGLAAELTEIDLAGHDSQPEQARLKTLFLRLDVVKMVRTRGRRLEVRQMLFKGLDVHVTRRADGSWDFDDIGKHFASRAAEEARTRAPDRASANELFRELRIAGVRIDDGKVTIVDEMLKRRLVVESLSLDLSEIIPGHDVSMQLGMTLDDGTTRAPASASLKLVPLPADLQILAVPQVDGSLSLRGLDLATWGQLVPAGWLRPSRGLLHLEAEGGTNLQTQQASGRGHMRVDGFELEQDGRKGNVANLQFDLQLDASLKEQRVTVHKLDVTGPGLLLSTRLSLAEHSLNGIENAQVDLKVDDLARIAGILPDGSNVLPPKLLLEGPFRVQLTGDARHAQLHAELDEARVGYAEFVDKPRGVPLRLDVTMNRQDEGVQLEPIRFALDQAVIAGKLRVPKTAGDPITGELTSGEVVLQQLERLFPALQEEQRKGRRLQGTVTVHAVATADERGRQSFDAQLGMRDMNVVLPRVVLKGGASMHGQITPADDDARRGQFELDATDLHAQIDIDADRPPIEKRRGMAAHAQLRAVKHSDRLLVEEASIDLGRSVLKAAGTVAGLEQDAPDIHLTTERLDVAFDDVRAVVPQAERLPRGGKARAHVTVDGPTAAPQKMALRVDELEVVTRKSRATGSVQVTGLSDPDVNARLDTVRLDFKELRAISRSDAVPEKGRLDGRLTVVGRPSTPSTLVVRLEDINADVRDTHIEGTVSVRDLDAPVFTARIAADRIHAGTWLNQSRGASVPSSTPARKSEEKNSALSRVSGTADISVGTLLYEQYVLQDVEGKVVLAGGVVTAEKLAWKMYGGEFVVDGTSFDTSGPALLSHVVVRAREVNLQQAVDAHVEKKGRVGGFVDVDADVRFQGTDSNAVLSSLQGPVTVTSPEITIRGMNIPADLFTTLNKALPIPVPVRHEMLDPELPTTFSAFAAEGRFGGAKFTFTQPMSATTEFGTVSLGGDVHFDSRVDLVGSATLQPSVVEDLTGGTLDPPSAVLVPVRIGGTWRKPRLAGIDVVAFAKGLGLEHVVGKAMEVADRARAEMEARTRAIQEDVQKLRAVAVDEAKAQASRAAEEARKHADRARQAAEQALRFPTEMSRKAALDAKERALVAARKAEEARAFAENLLRNPDASRRKAQEAARERVSNMVGDASRLKEELDAAAAARIQKASDSAKQAREAAEREAKAAAAEAKKRVDDARSRAKAAWDNFWE